MQFILLDTRFFRSDLVRMPYRDPGPTLGWYLPNEDKKATLLGEVQWQWLAGELSKPADVRIIVSSTQIITNAHNFEGWTNFPREREKLYRLLAEKGVNNALVLSGDRHSAGLYKTEVKGLGALDKPRAAR